LEYRLERQIEKRQKISEGLLDDRGPEDKARKLIVRNLHGSVDETMLRKEFEKFGEITAVDTIHDEYDRPTGTGSMMYAEPVDAACAVTLM